MKAETQGQHHTVPQAEMGLMQLQAKEHQGLLATTRSYREARKDSTQNLRGRMAFCYPDFGFLVSKTVTEQISLILSHPVCGT